MKKIKESIRKLKWDLSTFWLKNFGFFNGKKRLRLLSFIETNELLIKMITAKNPFAIVRLGGTEFSNLTNSNKVSCKLNVR
jgi:hypothetical protein